MRVVNFVLAVMFLWFAFLQVGASHPALWILIYGNTAAVCVFLLLVLYALVAITYLPAINTWVGQESLRRRETTETEGSRAHAWKCFGLLTCVMVSVTQILHSWLLFKWNSIAIQKNIQ